LARVEAEVVEVDVAPVAAVAIDDADEHLLAGERAQIDGDAAHVFHFGAGGAEEDLAGIFSHQFDAGGEVRPAADEERCPRVSDLEGDGGERALGPITLALVGADPVPALVPAAHVVAARVDGVALDGLPDEGLALGGPVLE